MTPKTTASGHAQCASLLIDDLRRQNAILAPSATAEVVRSLDGDSKILQFPRGSSRSQVEENFQGKLSRKFLNWGDLIYDERLPASGAQ